MREMRPCPSCQCKHIRPWGDTGGECEACELCMDDWNRRPIEDAISAERDALVNVLVEACGWEDTSYAHAVMHADHAIKNLRAEVADWHSFADVLTLEVAALKAELAKYTEPLTEEQVRRFRYKWVMGEDNLPGVDAAIRRVRADG